MSNLTRAPGSKLEGAAAQESQAEKSTPSEDPLANIITQVSPTGQQASGRFAGPARATRMPKQGTSKAEKKNLARSTEAGGSGAESQTAEGKGKSEQREGKAGPQDAVASTSKADAATSTVPGPAGDQVLREDADGKTHSQMPSSTLVGTTRSGTSDGTAANATPGGSAIGLTQDKPTDPAMTPTEPDPTVSPAQVVGVPMAAKQNVSGSASKAAKESANGSTGRKAQTSAGQNSTLSGASGSQNGDSKRDQRKPRGTNAATAESNAPQKKPSIGKRILAILTCSAFGSAALSEHRSKQEEIEMNEKRNQQASLRDRQSQGKAASSGAAGAGGLDIAQLSPGSRTSSRRASFDKTSTPGRGTRLPKEETGDVMSGAVVPPGSTFVVADPAGSKTSASSHKSREDDDAEADKSDDDDWLGEEQLEDDEEQTEEQRLIMQGGAGIPQDADGNPQPLLAPLLAIDQGRKCLVLDLDETLVHSSFKMIPNADFIVPVEIEGTVHNVYVIKRPGVDEFMRLMGQVYEVVVFTASLSKYADPVLDILDIHRVVRHRLFRESCYNHRGNYVKDLSQLGRKIEDSIIIDNSPASYIFHPNNAVPISSWFNDPHDTELTDLCPFLTELAEVDDVRAVLDGGL